MKWQSSPTLVTLEGEQLYDSQDIADYLGIDYEDAELLGSGALTVSDLNYLNAKYPEYMGIWGLIAKIGKGVAKGVKGIAKAVKKRRARKKAAASKAAAAKQQAAQQQALVIQAQQQAAAKAAQKKKLLMIGIPAGIGLLLLITMMNRPKK